MKNEDININNVYNFVQCISYSICLSVCLCAFSVSSFLISSSLKYAL